MSNQAQPIQTMSQQEADDLIAGMDWQTVSYGLGINQNLIDQLVADNFATTLERIARVKPILGSRAEWDALCHKYVADHFIQFLGTHLVVGENEEIVRATSGYDDPNNYKQASSILAPQMLGVAGFTIDQAIRRSAVTDGNEAACKDFQDLLAASPVTSREAESAAEAMAFYLSGKSTQAVRLLAPSVEAALRMRLTRAGVDVRRMPIGQSPGGVMTLGPVINGLNGIIADTWHFHFEAIVGKPDLLNLRNKSAHGLTAKFSDGDAALLIQALVWLACRSETPSP
jgi:hypothetical protein